MKSLVEWRWFGAPAVIVAMGLGCQRGPRTMHSGEEPAKTTTAKPAAKVVRPARQQGLLRLRTVRAFREWGVRETAADALARIGGAAVPALIDTLNDPDHEIRAQAARALARMGPNAEPAVPALMRALDDSNNDVRQGAARALGQIGSEAEQAVPALVKALKDPRNKPRIQPLEVETEAVE